MNFVKGTVEIIAFKALNKDIDSKWINWALEMLMAGYQSDNLSILAGERPPFNQFELHSLTDRVFKDLGIDYSDINQCLINYVHYIIDLVKNKNVEIFSALEILKNLYIDTDYEYLYQFYLFYFAKSDLTESENQWYIDGINRENIDYELDLYFIEWKSLYSATI
ncbi:hypothetical protein NUH30_19045 [Leptospira sp. 85282-16]|uniref:hypothetical protein n=1 Tax=Leptospira sp. 85282-16 TaxID=2971256 RepID=UPI0021BEF21A|nr:hypothetical protein [Leptospira sp. 85282-16]MCT8335791.1 hypothetical protein [Leptospira sp. 85282-16]